MHINTNTGARVRKIIISTSPSAISTMKVSRKLTISAKNLSSKNSPIEIHIEDRELAANGKGRQLIRRNIIVLT
jgi:hypothetical protein